MRYAPDATIDELLDYIAECTLLSICYVMPTTYTEASSTKIRATRVLDSGDFSIANGPVSGRRLTVAAQSGIVCTVYNAATGCWIALCKVSDTTLRYVTDLNGYQELAWPIDYVFNLSHFHIDVPDPLVP